MQMVKRPLIAITSRTYYRKIQGEPLLGIRPDFMVSEYYSDAICRAGGAPVFLPGIYDESYCNKIISTVAGVLISGGNDMDPALYNEEPHPKLGLVDVQKGEFEFMLTRMALVKRIPILGICGGHQMLNVALGGTLYQDISSQTSSKIKHQQDLTKTVGSHYVKIKKGTKLNKILGVTELRVNSTHHQAVKDLGRNLLVSATSSDGIIEAIESTKERFAVGVQWHPETLAVEKPVFQKIFDAFIKECAR